MKREAKTLGFALRSSRRKRHQALLDFEAQTIWPVGWLCDVLGVSRFAFRAWLTATTNHK
jgi:hypothetical protein